jgi:mono/diheme cytochrome c family protein
MRTGFICAEFICLAAEGPSPATSWDVTAMQNRIFPISVLLPLAVAGALHAAPAATSVEKGKYLATAGDCVSCHTAPGGQPLAGGLSVSTPFGTMLTPNITPDKDTGIGAYTDDQFYKVLHEGIGPDHRYLYPVFPFQWYTRITRDDALAIKAYLFSLPPVHAENKVNQLRFPFNIRASLIGWRQIFFKAGTFQPDPAKSAEINRGRYLVTGLGHCGECHTAHNGLGGTEKSNAYQGAEIDGWYAPNITSDLAEGIGGWSQDQLVAYFKTGIAPGKGIVAGPMAEVVQESLSKLTDADLRAIAAYLKSIPPKQAFPDTRPATATAYAPPGSGVYLDFCASCHQQNGVGVPGVIPALKGNGSVLAQGPENVIMVILGGLSAKGDYAVMPAVGAGMTDQQVAEVANYVRTAWTNKAPATASAGGVADLRKKTQTMLAGDECAMPEARISNPKSGIIQLLTAMTRTDMLNRIDPIVAKAKAAAPGAGRAELVNNLTAAYCPIVRQDPEISADRKADQLATFSQLVYSRLHSPNERW